MTLTTVATGSAVAPVAGPDDWHAIHVYYGSSKRIMLTECVAPLIDELRRDGLLSSYFFIHYWVEGPHLRLRLRPARAADAGTVLARAEDAIDAFLHSRPALYDINEGFFSDLHNTLFDLEYTGEERARYLGPDGKMLIRPNNTHSREPYEPEYGKYGGPRGVELAEWHFQHSSDLVITIMRTMNAHLRGAVLGISAQLMMVMATTFLPDTEAAADYLDRYHQFWRRAFDVPGFVKTEDYERAYEDSSAELRARFTVVRQALFAGMASELPDFLAGWAAHCAELRARAVDLAESGNLVLRSWDNTRDEVVTDPELATVRLLSPYLHMTNNRLGVTLSDEAYLGYVLTRALREVD